MQDTTAGKLTSGGSGTLYSSPTEHCLRMPTYLSHLDAFLAKCSIEDQYYQEVLTSINWRGSGFCVDLPINTIGPTSTNYQVVKGSSDLNNNHGGLGPCMNLSDPKQST